MLYTHRHFWHEYVLSDSVRSPPKGALRSNLNQAYEADGKTQGPAGFKRRKCRLNGWLHGDINPLSDETSHIREPRPSGRYRRVRVKMHVCLGAGSLSETVLRIPCTAGGKIPGEIPGCRTARRCADYVDPGMVRNAAKPLCWFYLA